MKIKLVLVLFGLLFTSMGGTFAQAADSYCFDETGYCIEGRFLRYWQQNGGLPVFGYPINAANQEYNRDTGQTYTTQWFERARFEQHTENAAPYDVLLGRLGDDVLLQNGIAWQGEPSASGPQDGCIWFAETRHNVCDQAAGRGFKTYWQTHGLNDPQLDAYGRSLQLFGLPLTEARTETNQSGDTVLTQWFERARFEWHPDKPDDFKVLLGLLGTDIAALGPHGASSYPENLTTIGGRLFFSADDGTHGRELWISDGTPAGTRLVKDIYPGPEFSTPYGFAGLNSIALFVARDDTHGAELWRSDGTESGTYLLKDIQAGPLDSTPFQITAYNNVALFIADDGVHGAELWRTDGTADGTYLLKDLNPGANGAWPTNISMGNIPFQLTVTASGVYFFANDGIHGDELWISDGTGAGTVMIADLVPGSEGLAFFELAATQSNGLFFSAWDAANGYGLWRSNGTAAGTQLLHTFAPLPWSGIHTAPSLGDLEAVGNRVYFAAYAPEYGNGFQLWASDGTPATTYLFHSGTYDVLWPANLLNVNGTLFFQSRSSGADGGLYRVDGDGTVVRVAFGSGYGQMIAVDERVYLLDGTTLPPDNDASAILTVTNADRSGVWLVHTFVNGYPYAQTYMAALNGNLMLSVATNQYGIELWRSDGIGSALVKDINPAVLP